jgi:S-adenosylmethionine synthetase
VRLFGASPAAVPCANDTSIGVGFAPLTLTEDLVLAVEHKLNAPETKALHPAIGEDIKVLAVRRGHLIQITVAAAMISRYIDSAAAYRDAVDAVRDLALDAVRERLAAPASAGGSVRPDRIEGVELVVNAADDVSGAEYLTLSGTSAESGDDGQVGRGNRLSGLITPMRPMTLEAASGKNPRTHVGRIYSEVAGAIARACAGLEGVRAVECLLVSRIGSPIHEPWMASVRLDHKAPLPRQTAIEVVRLVHDELERLADPESQQIP